MDELDRKLINRLQYGLPLVADPYAQVAQELDCTVEVLLQRLERLLAEGVLTRFGPLFDVERIGGAFTLAAMAVPEERFEEVSALLAELPQVAHNYQRDHALNMWFVLATESPAEIDRTLQGIAQESGLPVLNLPKEKTYYVNLHFSV